MIGIRVSMRLPERMNLDTKQALTLVAGECLRRMHRRIDEGIDVHGVEFAPYTESYAKWKRDHGREPGSAGDWLRYTGEMLRAHGIVSLTKRAFVIGFTGARNAIVAWANNRLRPFVGLPPEEKLAAIKVARDFLLSTWKANMQRR